MAYMLQQLSTSTGRPYSKITMHNMKYSRPI